MNAILPIARIVGIWAAHLFVGLIVSSALFCKVRRKGSFFNPFSKRFWVGQSDQEIAARKLAKAAKAEAKAEAKSKAAEAKVTPLTAKAA